MAYEKYGLFNNKGAYDKAWDDFWEAYQCGGTRTFYEYAFKNTNFEYIRPKYKVIPANTSRSLSVFEDCLLLKKIEAQYFDFSTCNMSYGHFGLFRNCPEIREVEDIKMPAGNYYQTWHNCQKLETIAKMRVNTSTTFDDVFIRAYALKNITIEGIIGQSGLSFSDCPLLTGESVYNIIFALDTTTTSPRSITFKSTAQQAFNDYYKNLYPETALDDQFTAEVTNLTEYGWTISLI